MSGNVKLLTPSSGSVTITTGDTASNLTVTVPAATDTLVNLSSSQTLNNKTLSNPAFTGSPSGGTFTSTTITAANGNTVEATSGPTSTQLAGQRNKIINGAMMIDQRNAGAAITLASGANGYPADRWYSENQTDGTITAQQVTDAPAGFAQSLKITVTATDSSLASDQSAFIQQRIEGFNSADLLFGSASAATISISFWVKSSVTGVLGGALANAGYNRGYSFSYTVNAANTWERKTIQIAGDTTGTWEGATNLIGLRISFAAAAGSARGSAAGAWGSFVGIGVSGQINLLATNGATLQFTGAQLEKGATATPFENRLYGTELALCQRYYYRITPGSGNRYGMAQCTGTTGSTLYIPFPVQMRASPSALEQSGTATDYRQLDVNGNGINSSSAPTFNTACPYNASVGTAVAGGLGAGNASVVFANSVASYMGWSAEL